MTLESPSVLTIAGSDSSGGAGIQVRICPPTLRKSKTFDWRQT